MQRVKVGLLGLATVVLLIAFASAIMRTATRETPVSVIGAPKPSVVADMLVTNAQAGSGDPTVETGVAPTTGNIQAGVAARR